MIEIPQRHNFPSWLEKNVVKETGCKVPDWEICVKRNEAWSIVLPYLISTNYRDKDDFSRRLKTLTGSDKNLYLVKKFILSFNPFRNRYSWLYSEVLRQVVEKFKANLGWNRLATARDKLSAASAMLRCPIIVIREEQKIMRKEIYAENDGKCLNVVALISRHLISEEGETYEIVHNFLLDHQLGLRMKNAALRYFLKEAKIPKKLIWRVESAVKNGEHFLISVLNNDCQSIIPQLYKSPYIVSKLAEAGFETDPRTRDAGGLSALYHALALGNLQILYKLYYFAANNCFQSEASYRNPDSKIVNNLYQLYEILSSDLAKPKVLKHRTDDDNLRRTCDDLLRLNKFLIDVNSKVLNLKNKLNYYEPTDDIVFEACKRRDIVVSVLDIYDEFFNVVRRDNINLSPMDDYIMFHNYYGLIDLQTAIFFFDNIILLKERLELEDKNQFSMIESSFYFSALCNVVVEQVNIATKNVHPLTKIDINSLYIFPLIMRLRNRNKIREFNECLHNTIISKDNVVRCIPHREILDILKSYPVIKDCIHIKRLKSYMNRAQNVKVIDIKSVLVIERALQVIGEYIIPEKSDFSFRRFLSMTLPKEIVQVLRRTRHELSHLKSYSFKSKVECEKNFSLFRSIQREIRTIQFYFKPVFHTQILSGIIYLLKLFEEELGHIRSSEDLYTSSISNPFHLRSKDINIVLSGSLMTFEIFKRFYTEMFKITLRYVETDVSNEIDWSKDWDSVKNDVSYALWPLKWLIELLQHFGDVRIATLLDTFQELTNCERNDSNTNQLKDMTNNFIIKCIELLSAFTVSCKERKFKPLNYRSIERFLKILQGFTYLSNEEKEGIRREIPEAVRRGVSVKEKLVKYIKEGFSMNIDEEFLVTEITQLSKNKRKLFLELYRDKSLRTLDILETLDPIAELEDVFSKNSVNKKKYDFLCEKLQFSEETKKKK